MAPTAAPAQVDLQHIQMQSGRRSMIEQLAQSRKQMSRRNQIIAGAACACVIGVVVLVVVLVVGESKHAPRLQVPTTFTADFVLAAPRSDDAPAAKVSGSLHKTVRPDGGWQVTGQASVTSHNQTVTVVVANDGAVYFTAKSSSGEVLTQGCWTVEDAPPLDALKLALESSTPLTATEYSGPLPTSCGSRQQWIVQFEGVTLAACVAADGSLELVGQGVTATMSDILSDVSPHSPYVPLLNQTANNAPMRCMPVYAWSTGATTTAAASRRLGVGGFPFPPFTVTVSFGRRALRPVATTASKGPFNTCVFVHGAGQSTSGISTSTFTSYWGSVHNRVACVNKKFLRMDTLTRGWDDPVLHASFCSAAATSGVIQNTIVFAHGTGNLIVAAATMSNACKFNFTSSSWTEVQPSYNVARLTDYAASFCASYPTYTDAQLQLQSDVRLCSGASVAQGWKSAASGKYRPTGFTWSAVASTIKNQVEGAMCGMYAPGLLSSAYWAGVPSYTTSSYGDVAWSTCWDSDYGNRFAVSPSAYYAADVNYLGMLVSPVRKSCTYVATDVTCRNGDGAYGAYRMPCTWFKTVSS